MRAFLFPLVQDWMITVNLVLSLHIELLLHLCCGKRTQNLKQQLEPVSKLLLLYYLYDPAYGNENLNPEESFGWDFGIEQYLFAQNFSIGTTFFYNKYSDMFGFDYVTFKTINIKQAVTKGLEVCIETKPMDELSLKANYTFTDARDTSPDSPDFDKKLLRRPESKLGFYTSYSFIPKANINAEVVWVGVREDIDFSTYQRTELKGYVSSKI